MRPLFVLLVHPRPNRGNLIENDDMQELLRRTIFAFFPPNVENLSDGSSETNAWSFFRPDGSLKNENASINPEGNPNIVRMNRVGSVSRCVLIHAIASAHPSRVPQVQIGLIMCIDMRSQNDNVPELQRNTTSAFFPTNIDEEPPDGSSEANAWTEWYRSLWRLCWSGGATEE
ncbi:hypothetical protein SCHPADRAFT_697211 [Schizopora paradoxa]|uniref:Uncharacterized protein n=1 Tax=Schizopora paradoxa TaxID=27342 RepID=A0A0H2R4E0_9AGAM|nr:hypothetical protein SCHPADRAFT_697211 [Schizopora paradoxa]